MFKEIIGGVDCSWELRITEGVLKNRSEFKYG